MKPLKKIVVFLLLTFLIAQFFGPEKNDGDLSSIQVFIAETNPPEDVKLLLKESCFDCHSNTTRYPWYYSITPVNYWMADHVEEGKEELNFSNWASYSVKRKEHKMEEVWEEVKKKHMPLDSYTWMHAKAKFSKNETKKIVLWAKQVQVAYKAQIQEE